MAHDSSKPSDRRTKPAHPSVTDSEAWKVNPSTETDADQGENAKVARERKVEENAPLTRQRPTR
jgi:hypothetical protein